VGLSLFAQSVVKPRNLAVTVNRTTNLIFPSPILSIDRGSEWILVQKSTGNILRVKADTVFNDTTNLSVITSDGKLYSFLVSYQTSPAVMNLDLGAGDLIVNDTALAALAREVLERKNNLHGFQYTQGKVSLSLTGIYTNSEVLVCKLRLANNSSLSFEMGRLRLAVKGTARGKRMPVQESEIRPLLVQTAGGITPEKQANVLVIVLSKTALGRQQILQMDLSEKNAERHLHLEIPQKWILKASLLK
jgi:conjugative transposon TraN protein